MTRKKTKTFPIGRDSKTGRFVPVEDARRRTTIVVERIPKVGRGDTNPKSSKTLETIKSRYDETFKRLAKK